jgi:hypothetical protein
MLSIPDSGEMDTIEPVLGSFEFGAEVPDMRRRG